MSSEKKLNLSELNVESFLTSEQDQLKGGGSLDCSCDGGCTHQTQL